MKIWKWILAKITNIRKFFIVHFAVRCYNSAVKYADAMSELYHNRAYYVVVNPDTNKLCIISRKDFRNIRRKINTLAIHSGLGEINHDTMEDLKRGCFYHTRLRETESFANEKELRRLAYINYVLELAGITEGEK